MKREDVAVIVFMSVAILVCIALAFFYYSGAWFVGL